MSGVLVTAVPVDHDPDVPHRHEAEDFSDAQGRFRISNLEDRSYHLRVEGDFRLIKQPSPIVTAGESASVELRAVRDERW